ncbi:MAG TPA: glycosyltransferase [Thermoanaerobaculia bacterium]|nr:glycosyltransferase [Thermoanaerobaculia bacterium]
MSRLSVLSVVIAAYNEQETIEPLTRRLHHTLSGLAGRPWEVLYVVEGRDRTREILERLDAELGGGLRILYAENPSGLGNAFRRGFAALAPDTGVVVTLDADLNHQPEEIPRLVDALERTGSDIVVGSRFLGESQVEGTPAWKRFLSGVMNVLMRYLFGVKVRDKTSGFRVYRAEALRSLQFINNDFAFLPEILIRANNAGLRIVEEPIHFIFRREGTSKMAIVTTCLSYLRLLWMRLSLKRNGGAGERLRVL